MTPLPSENDDLIAIAPCWSCKQPFSFHPDTVVSVPIDPQTGLPPDVNPDGGHREPDPAAARRAVKQALCNDCAGRANQRLRAAGRPIIQLPKESSR